MEKMRTLDRIKNETATLHRLRRIARCIQAIDMIDASSTARLDRMVFHDHPQHAQHSVVMLRRIARRNLRERLMGLLFEELTR
jgi:hypothetical protein